MVTLCAVIGLALSLGWLGILFIGVSEGDVPPASVFDEIPVGASAGQITQECGSGGCYLEQRLTFATRAEAQSAFEAAGAGAEKVCWHRLSLDPRQLCLHAQGSGLGGPDLAPGQREFTRIGTVGWIW